ncbi:hypothetical protein L226DRAFT_489691 [Lentinus tigrinus ALCF2SS1-7]|uniref:F-box domain-containing protein n=1 Tax=Lentinus tigrinus ALCF2SS1-6 TaxID=1328759 RepID=A0A5C2S3X6_9APHY|nr:hypothetical protein L227DRAFT_550905 [Lentinus tigrinus ALCF2SS1-6]RPD72991.1 hypothetical protein L226DRAFT_489691 [Lentinus tigrinus ALCF2SS1-7]
MNQSPVHATLYNYDLLLCLFEHVHLGRKTTLASCALVCHAWEEPASYVLWSALKSFHPLWNLLIGRSFSPDARRASAFWEYTDAEDFVKVVVEREPERWKRFLHRASHVREVEQGSCGKRELAFIHALTKYNQGRTFLPSLYRLSWRHAVPTDTSVLLLSSQSLRDLQLIISRLGIESTGGAFATPERYQDYHDVDPVLVGLAASAPSLTRLSIAGGEGPGPTVVPFITPLTHLRELYLFNQAILLKADHVRSLLESLENLEVVFVRIYDFSYDGPAVCTPNLQDLRLQGSSKDLCSVLSGFLDAPHLHSLTLKSEEGQYSQMDHYLFPLIASSNFARSLRKVSVTVIKDPSEVVWNDPAAFTSYSTIIQPLLQLPELDDVEICLANPLISCGDADIAAIARAWPRIQRLSLAYSPFGPRNLPPLASLQYFVDHCPELRQLAMTKLTLPEHIEVPLAPRDPPHPLMYLDLKMTFPGAFDREGVSTGKLEIALVARFFDHLFPNLVLSVLESFNARRFAKLSGWTEVEQEIRTIRSQRLSDQDAVIDVAARA